MVNQEETHSIKGTGEKERFTEQWANLQQKKYKAQVVFIKLLTVS